MAANASYLTDAKFGYDMVLATTQGSINATMKSYLRKVQGREIRIILTSTPHSPVTNLVPWDTFKTTTNGSDPFTVKNGTTWQDKDVDNLSKARFKAGIKITLGLPQNFDLDKLNTIPDVVDLANGASAVSYNMLCADIVICEMTFDQDGALPFVSLSQNTTRNKAWVMQSAVNIVLNKSNQNWDSLPDTVKSGLKNMSGTMFDVSQLLFDLNQSKLMTPPQIVGLDAGSEAAGLLNRYFCSKYFTEMLNAGQPILAYTAAPTQQTSTFKPTDMNFHVSPLVHESLASLKTLDYLMSINDKPLSPGVDFQWDWVSAADAAQIHGVIAINRDTFKNYIQATIFHSAKTQVFIPRVRNWLDGLDIWFECHPDYLAVQDSDLTVTAGTGSNLFSIHFDKKADDQAGASGGSGAISLQCTYDCNVSVSGSQIVATSSFVVHLFIRALQNRNAADIVSKSYTDTFDLTVNGAGGMLVSHTEKHEDHSGTDSVNAFSNFFADVNSVFNSLKRIDYVGNSFTGTAIDSLGSFIFPGARTFAFKDFRFSDHQDLLCSITYADPA